MKEVLILVSTLVFLEGKCLFPREINALEMESRQKRENNRRCTMLTINLETEIHQEVLEVESFIHIDSNVSNILIAEIGHFMKKDVHCAIITTTPKDFETARDIMEGSKEAQVILVTEKKLAHSPTHDFPVSYVIKQNPNIVFTFCPGQDHLFPIIQPMKTFGFKSICYSKNFLKGRVVNVSVYGDPPWVIMKYKEDQVAFKGGSDVDALEIVAHKLGFNINYILEKSNVGDPKNNFRGGVLGSVMAGRSNIGFSISLEAIGFFDGPWVKSKATEIGHAGQVPKPKSPLGNVTYVFNIMVWILILLVVIVVPCLFKTMIFVYSSLESHKTKVRTDNGLNIFLQTFSILVEQDGIPWFQRFPRTSAGSLLKVIFQIFSLLLVTAFMCNLRAILTKPEFEKRAESLAEIIASGKPLYYWKGMLIIETFKDSPVKMQRDAYAYVKANDNFHESTDSWFVLDSVEKEGGYFFSSPTHMLAGRFHYKKRYGYYPFYYLKHEPLTQFYGGFIFNEAWKWHEQVKEIMARLDDAGILTHLMHAYGDYDFHQEEDFVDSVRLTLAHFALSFIILIVMLSIATLVFLWETKSGN